MLRFLMYLHQFFLKKERKGYENSQIQKTYSQVVKSLTLKDKRTRQVYNRTHVVEFFKPIVDKFDQWYNGQKPHKL